MMTTEFVIADSTFRYVGDLPTFRVAHCSIENNRIELIERLAGDKKFIHLFLFIIHFLFQFPFVLSTNKSGRLQKSIKKGIFL